MKTGAEQRFAVARADVGLPIHEAESWSPDRLEHESSPTAMPNRA
jgi:hypothetical protein